MSLNISAPIIFCVEDETDLRELLVEEIEDAGYKVIEAADGQGAIAALVHTRPDLILCDILMPNMDGYELLKYVRANHPDLDDVPFIFLSAQNEAEQVVSGKHAGADDYLVKPVDFDLMLATIQARLRQVQRWREKTTPEQVSVKTSYPHISQTLNFISSAIILLGSQAQVLFMNSAAQQLVAKGICPILSTMMVRKNDALYCQHKAIRAAICATSKKEDYIDYLSLSRNDGCRDLLLTICALSSDSNEKNAPRLALFFCHTEGADEPAPIKALATLFQLTPMEGRVAWAFAQGVRADEIAEKFNISITTVAFHKRNIFQKTHTNRQADLIALLLSLPVRLDGYPKRNNT